jgi:hypothetical protein
LQGKANFLYHFIPNYAKITHGFTQLLKKDSEFVWDTIANNAFEALKLSLTRASLLFPLDYSRNYFLYLAASEYTIGMVLVQEDDANDEHVIYYLSQSLTPTEINYLHVKKLALAAVQAVQCFRHYFLSRVGSQPNFFRLLSKAAYTPCRITTNYCRIVLMDIHLIFAIITIQYRSSFSQLQV